MHARQTMLQVDPSRIDEGIRLFREQVMPVVRQQGGKGVRLLVDRRSGKVQAISLWETEQAAQAAQTAMNQQRDQAAQQLGGQGATTELFEVAVLEDF